MRRGRDPDLHLPPQVRLDPVERQVRDAEELDYYVVWLAQRSGKHI